MDYHPRMTDTKVDTTINVRRERLARWDATCSKLGYGPHGRQKFLDRCLQVAESMPILFQLDN